MVDNGDGEDKPSFLTLGKKIIIGAGSGVVGFTSIVFAYIDSKTSAIELAMNDKYANVRQYVDDRHNEVKDKLENIERLLIKIDDRIYELTKKEGK